MAQYLNNKDFLTEMVRWKDQGYKKPIPDTIASFFIGIVSGIASKTNFSGYTYIEDMKSEALEHCVKYADRFDPEKSKNPFGYFSQIAWNAFLQTIKKEKKYATLCFDINKESVENSHKFNRNLISGHTE